MATYLLNDHDRATIDRRPLMVSVTVDGSRSPVLLGARLGQEPDRTALFPRPSLMILPSIADRTVVRVSPVDAAVFPDSTVVRMTLQTEALGGLEADTVVVQAIDVSGLPHRDLAVVDVDGPMLSVSALGRSPVVELGELAAAARAAAVAALGVDRVGDDEAVDVVVALDISASMTAAIEDGSVEAVVDVVAGLSHVVGSGRPLRICLLGERPTWLPAVGVQQLARETAAAIAASGLECGFRSTPAALDGVAAMADTVTYVVTDGVPPDVDDLRATRRRAGDLRHLVTVRSAGGWDAGPVGGGFPATVLEPPPSGRSASEHLLSSSAALSALVSSLLVELPATNRAARR